MTLLTEALAKAKSDNNELLKLRGEIGLLRNQIAGIDKLRAENLRLETSLKDMQAVSNNKSFKTQTQIDVPRDAWSFSGYASPKAALETWVWALDKSDKENIIACLVPEEQDKWRKMLEGAGNTGSNNRSPFTAYHIISTEAISDEDSILTIVSDFPDGRKTGEQRYELKKVGTDWKMAGQAKN